MSSRLAELRTLWRLVRGSRTTGADHGERMEAFYGEQAADYDAFRRRLLSGREDLIERLAIPAGAIVADLGGGTGANLDFVPPARLHGIGHWHIVDLAGSLLRVAEQRIADRRLSNVSTHQADATRWRLPETPVDIVLLSYSLTMMPDWPALLEHVEALLRPGGQIAVVDFYVSRKHPPPDLVRHGWWTRHGWTTWFAWDDVFLSADHLPTLLRRFQPLWIEEHRAPVPWLPWVRVPVYQFIGRKAADAP